MVSSIGEFICIFTACTAVTLMLLVAVAHPYFYYEHFNKHMCNITDVEYPTEMPTYNNQSDLWVKCDCGRYCSSLTPCINLYSSVKSDLIIQNEFLDHKICTFYDETCLDNEDPRNIQKSLEESIVFAESYINATVDCYYDDNISAIYLNNDIPVIFLVLTILICLVYCCCSLKIFASYIEKIYYDKDVKICGCKV